MQERDDAWSPLVDELARHGVVLDPALLRSLPFRMAFDPELLAELDR